jgi:CheY-like chemotaxis protein
MVVDDDDAIRAGVCESLERLGCRVIPAADGVEALESLRHEVPVPPCLILTDLNMPRLDGASLAKAVRAGDSHARTPIVSMTADPRSCPPTGVVAQLTKPFALGDCSRIVAGLCRGGPAQELVLEGEPRRSAFQ